jgi:phage gp36-like protein
MAGPLYAQLADLKNALTSTDGGTGTPAELNDTQLTQCLQTASDRVSVYFGSVMDGSTPQAMPPSIFYDLTLDIAVFWSWRMYLKGKVLATGHPVITAYNDAMQMLKDARDGKLRLDVEPAGQVGSETGVVINRIPPIFTGDDSNTRVSPFTGHLESDVPIGPGWAPRATGLGPIYQG